MNVFGTLRRFFGSAERSAAHLAEIREGVANMTDVIRRQAEESRQLQADGMARMETLLESIRDAGVEQAAAAALLVEEARQAGRLGSTERVESLLAGMNGAIAGLAEAIRDPAGEQGQSPPAESVLSHGAAATGQSQRSPLAPTPPARTR